MRLEVLEKIREIEELLENMELENVSELEELLEEFSEKLREEYYLEFLKRFQALASGEEEITDAIDDTFTMDEYSDILDINSGNDVEINGNKIKAVDFLEIVYDLFVKE